MSTSGTEGIHSCSYFCTRPACIQAQRDELRDKLTAGDAAREALTRLADAADEVGMRYFDTDSMSNEVQCHASRHDPRARSPPRPRSNGAQGSAMSTSGAERKALIELVAAWDARVALYKQINSGPRAPQTDYLDHQSMHEADERMERARAAAIAAVSTSGADERLALHLKVRGVALWIKGLRGQAPAITEASFETLLLAADALASTDSKPAGDAAREALTELVALKDLKERLEQGRATSSVDDFNRRQQIAWEAARRALVPAWPFTAKPDGEGGT